MSRRALVVIGVLVVAVVLGVALFTGRGNGSPASQYLTATAQVTDVVAEAVANGTVEPSQTYSLCVRCSGAAGRPRLDCTGCYQRRGG